MYNFWASSETETIALAPRAPFIGAEGQFEGHEEQWKTANKRSHAFLQYNPKTIAGELAPPPQRNAYEPPIQAITNARLQSSEDLKSTTGIYDAGLGNRSNETSGVAIQRRAHQSQTANFHFIDNLSRSIRHLGRILIEIIPKVYDTPRTVRIIGEDGQEEIVAINQIFEKGGKKQEHRLDHGKYDVTVSSGPSYATKRQEAVDAMLQLTQSYPQVAEIAGDLMVKNMDWPGADEISERLKKMIPPHLLESPEGEEIPPQVQAQMAQMNQMIEQLTQKLNEASSEIKEKKLELESKERIEFAKMEVELKKALADIDSREGTELFKQEIAEIQRRQDLDRKRQEIEMKMNGQGAQGAIPQQNQQPTGGYSPGY